MTAESKHRTYNHTDLATVESRIFAWCEWFGHPKPRLKIEDGSVLLTDTLVYLSRFCAAPGARLGHFPFESDGAFPA